MKVLRSGLATAVVGLVMAAGSLAGTSVVVTAHADGTLPPQPYRYLHPPPAVAGSTLRPLSGTRVLSLGYLESFSWFGFSDDGQVGISGDKAAFTISRAASGVVIQMNPVDTPPGLPAGLEVKGNAYRIVALEQDANNGPARLVKRVDVILRWPHLPTAMYEFREGKWHQICNRKQLVFSPATIACSTSTLGVFAAVGAPSPTSTTASSRSSGWLTRAIPWITVFAVLVAAAALGYFIRRSSSSPLSSE